MLTAPPTVIGSTVSDKTLTSRVGETVRLFVGDGGPNVTSSFHVIGQIFDTVYPEGNLAVATHNVQTTAIPAGGSAITEFKMSVPGTFIIVDHSLTRAFNRGALAQLKAVGEEDKLVYSGKQFDLVYQPEGTGIRVASANVTGVPVAKSREERIKLGAEVFSNICQACHQEDGEGVPDAFPPFAKSDYLNADKVRAIKNGHWRPRAEARCQRKGVQRRDAGLGPLGRGHRERAYLRLQQVGQRRP